MKAIVSAICLLLLHPGAASLRAQDMHSRFDSLMFGGRVPQSTVVKGHSHNDYEQKIPFYTAYFAGMESIEIDLFYQNDTLYAAHDKGQIQMGRSLEQLYLKPLMREFRKNGGHAFADQKKSLQLLIDLKEDYRKLMPPLLKLLGRYRALFADAYPQRHIRLVISGDVPPPAKFADYPAWISFDGRPSVAYTDAQRQRLGMISDDLRSYTEWNGKGVPARDEMAKIIGQSQRAKEAGIPFRLWGAPESVNTWLVLEKMGVTWLNTDHPVALQEYIQNLESSRFRMPKPYAVYQPTYAADRKDVEVKNVILLIGDGMGLGHIQAATAANHGASHMQQMQAIGFSNTSSYSPGNTDSGAGGSAIATGKKTFNGMLSVDTNGRALPRIPDILRPLHIHSGILSTGDASDATPAAFYASHRDRNASQEITGFLRTNTSVDILVGGRPGPFRQPDTWRALQTDLAANGIALLDNAADFARSDAQRMVLFLPDTAVRPVKDGRGPVLRDLLRHSITKLHGRGNGFFIMAEGAQIDYGGHARDLTYVTTETMDFDQAVGEALRFADADGHTLVIVVADHETGALTLLDVDEQRGAIQGSFASNDHSSMYVPVLAYGPQSSAFCGFYQNTALFDKIMALFGAAEKH